MNLFRREPGALRDVDLTVGQALADVATIGILSERAIRRGEVLTEQLQTALNRARQRPPRTGRVPTQ